VVGRPQNHTKNTRRTKNDPSPKSQSLDLFTEPKMNGVKLYSEYHNSVTINTTYPSTLAATRYCTVVVKRPRREYNKRYCIRIHRYSIKMICHWAFSDLLSFYCTPTGCGPLRRNIYSIYRYQNSDLPTRTSSSTAVRHPHIICCDRHE
jgi:hypothetical protein